MAVDWQVFNIEVDIGETAFLDGVVTTAGAPQPITGWTIWATFKRRVSDLDAAAVIQKSTALGGVTITNGAQGLYTVTLSPADTLALPQQRLTLFADHKARDGAGNLFFLAKGKVTFRPVATDASS